MTTFDDIVGLPDEELGALIRALTPSTLAMALKTAPEPVAARFYKNMSRGAGNLVEDMVGKLQNPTADEIAKRRDEVVTLYLKLKADGTLEDQKQLDLLATFHWVVGGITGLFALLPSFHILLAWAMISAPEAFKPNPRNSFPPPEIPALFPWFILGLASLVIVSGLTLAVCMALSGRNLKKREKYSFSFVVACVECVFMPFGTILGVFTIIVLSRDSVKALYGNKPGATPRPSSGF